ncbi:MAG: glycine betaine ABC transporter substrate-binding protein, partial [Vibrio gallaecicus]
MNNSWKKTLTVSIVSALTISSNVWAEKLPGEGVSIQPLQSTVAEETFQTLIVNRALEKLGYEVQPTKEVDYNVGYTSIAKGDATFLAVGWFPLHADKYKMSGGDEKFYREGQYISGAAQGYLIDKKTAEKY